MMLIKVGDQIPPEHYVHARRTIPAIDTAKVKSVIANMEDVASHSSDIWRESVITSLTVHMIDGTSFVIGQEAYRLAVSGGGDFWGCLPNSEHWAPLTKEQHEAYLEREAEEAFWDYY